MSQDFVTQLRLQLREAAQREERRAPSAQRLARARRGLPGPAPLAVALAVALLALAVAIGVLQLHDEFQPAKPKVIETFKVSDALTSLSGGFGAGWAADPVRGEVLRIDPKSHEVTARVKLGGGEVRVATGAGAVWALYGDLLTAGAQAPVVVARIDPRTNRVVARIPARSPQGKNFAPLSLRADRHHVWIIGAQGAMRIDPATNAGDRFVAYGFASRPRKGGRPEPARPPAVPVAGAVAEGERVWVLATDGRLLALDARTGRTVDEDQLRAADSHLVLGDSGTLALVDADRISVIERTSGRRLWSVPLGGTVRALFPAGDSVWAVVSRDADGGHRLVRLDADDGRRTGRLTPREPDAVGLARVAGAVWIASPGGAITVVR